MFKDGEPQGEIEALKFEINTLFSELEFSADGSNIQEQITQQRLYTLDLMKSYLHDEARAEIPINQLGLYQDMLGHVIDKIQNETELELARVKRIISSARIYFEAGEITEAIRNVADAADDAYAVGAMVGDRRFLKFCDFGDELIRLLKGLREKQK